ncbi:hypothetical protein CLPU_10c00220 [Gottschalkia purinilytica]|uniref:Uncharacterized protein n=1 Tax=Gottschalkia purinilytica TaxID=1503 RepID=A0A0L0W8V3_GOTPU|nr:hypothetical protein [Gottschalkia purinilytica]KNF07968.1 hypothetical protein CLPU_10c00220 [Gottschalkia purinilytica]
MGEYNKKYYIFSNILFIISIATVAVSLASLFIPDVTSKLIINILFGIIFLLHGIRDYLFTIKKVKPYMFFIIGFLNLVVAFLIFKYHV